MRKIFLLVFIIATIAGNSQSTDENDKKQILEKVELFFQALEKQDTNLYKNVFIPDATGWAIRSRNDSVITTTWRTIDRVKRLINPASVVEEKLLSYEIKVHKNIAMAWVPYTLSVSGKFSHCGVDLFTFIKTDQGWKINTCSFTVEPDGCDVLKNAISH
jgi:hypothetical protein